jgi:hypothetical protein
MGLYSMWVHGSSVQPDWLDRIGSITRSGFHTRIEQQEQTENWFHFAIPTPAIVSGSRVSIARVIPSFRCWSNAVVTAVHVRAGRQEPPIAAFDGLRLSGDHPSEVFTISNRPQVFSAIDIGVHVTFYADTPLRVDFAAAPAEFIV